MLMTGKHPGHAFIRNNKPIQPEGQYPIPKEELTLAELLQSKGYVTGAFGKWGLGGPETSGEPINQGFNRFYGYNCQREAHNYYPPYLWSDRQKVDLDNPDFSAHQKLPDDADPNDPASYERYQANDYGPDRIGSQALQFIQDHKNEPFFLFYPTIVPHLALQVPDDSLAEYQGLWEDPPYPGGNGYLPHYAPRAAYAAMITRMDDKVGRMIDLVAELGLENDTIFVFTSDNGPTYNRLGGSDSDFFNSAGPLRGLKGSLYEGGIRVPAIVRWKGKIEPGTQSVRITGFEDWMPTLLELIGPGETIPENIDGISFAPTLLGEKQKPRPFLYREFPAYGGQQSIRIGPWKGIRRGLKSREPDLHIELYDLEQDIGETRDVSADHPEIIDRMKRLMREQHTVSDVFPFPALDRL
jgi:arylsulfatase A-like enzyme